MPLYPGTALGPYQVTAQIGAGGMGEVYRARDTKLDRDVALKVLPDAFTSDPDRLARFEREAKVLASLNHPNIGHIYGLEEAEGTKALVLELVEGPTLADRIAEGPIPVDEALPIAKQIAEALEAAHEQGIIHRDLKPANVKVRADGTVKVLDFGLAKAFQPAASRASASESPTISLTAAATQMGMVIGTAAYMAPEQASGKPVDKRADVWAFGVVLFEMLTGTRPFVGDDVSKTLAHVIAIDPDWSTLPRNLSPVLGAFLRGCLAKEPSTRVRDIGDVGLAIRGAFEMANGGSPSPARTGWQRPVPLAGAALALALFGALVSWFAFRQGPALLGPPAQFQILPAADGPLGLTQSQQDVAISPDGSRIVYLSADASAPQFRGGLNFNAGEVTNRRLFIRRLEELDAVALQGADPGQSPFFSPNGEWVGFQATDTNDLMRVSVLGGPRVLIADLRRRLRGVSWGPDDRIVFATTGTDVGLQRVSADGGEPETLTMVEPTGEVTTHRWPEVLPNGKAVLYTVNSDSSRDPQIALLSLDYSQD